MYARPFLLVQSLSFIVANLIVKTGVGVHQWATYQSTTNFANPETFAPERWLDDPPEVYKNDNKAAMQPFSTGPRNCIGKK